MKGFTLMEMVIVVAIIMVVGLIISEIFDRSIRANIKVQMLATIKQNGQNALEVLDKTIRAADDVVCVSPDNKQIVVSSHLGSFAQPLEQTKYSRFRIIPENRSSTPPITGMIQQDSPQSYSDALCVETLSQQMVILTDSNSRTGVSVVNGSFTLNEKAGFKDSVTISFDIDEGVAAPKTLGSQIDPTTFNTSVQLR